MDLQEVRGRINEIDESMMDLYNERLGCSAMVAEVKLVTGDQVFKPAREKEIYGRYSDDALGQSHRAFVRKVVQLSRKYQYSIFKKNRAIDEAFYKWISDDCVKVFEEGGMLELTLNADEGSDNGLDIKNILEIAADTKLELKRVVADSGTSKVSLVFNVNDDESSREEAFVLAYMLYKETI